MPPQTVFLIRHGEVNGNTLVLDRLLTAADFNNLVDEIPHEALNARGRQQARTAAARLVGHNLTCLYCSPLPRARETAAILAETLDIPIIIRNDLYELLPAPLLSTKDTAVTLKRAYIRSGLRLGNPLASDIETAIAAYRRIKRAFQTLTEDNRTNFGIVGHQGIFRILFLWVHATRRWELAYGDTTNCGISVITRR
ncbi:MAG: histidine phosphatase family protein [Anaerolineae bacterium]|nr:histidine phosphatase family protein [Anaerolineae bacterium]